MRTSYLVLGCFVLLFFSIPLIRTIEASPDLRNTGITKQIDLALGSKVKVAYNWTIGSDVPAEIIAGESRSFSIQASGGTASLSVFLPVINQWFSIGSFNVPIGSGQRFTVALPAPASSISLEIDTTTGAEMRTDGPGSVSPRQLTWGSPGAFAISLSANPAAQSGDIIRTVVTPFAQINLRFTVYFLTLTAFDSGPITIAREDASPVFYSTAVKSPSMRLGTAIALLAVSAIAALGILYFFLLKRRDIRS